ncbi:hypothetical protein PLICRDRAFT_41711 [Plicaturopsis crispa FD-325 SS-3]|nr:hypothetical protein PLICRDRAFT_41711 [Plicaturopsis crispa FD-325 SS-3]
MATRAQREKERRIVSNSSRAQGVIHRDRDDFRRPGSDVRTFAAALIGKEWGKPES